MAASWNALQSNNFNDTILGQLDTFRPIAAKHRPIRRVTDSNRDEMISTIFDAETAVRGDSDLPDWVNDVLSESLARVKRMLVLLPYFGYEPLIRKLIIIKSRTEALHENLYTSEAGASGPFKAIFQTINAIVVVGGLIALPAVGADAYGKYSGWITGPVTKQITAPPAVKALPAPKTEVQKPQSDQGTTTEL